MRETTEIAEARRRAEDAWRDYGEPNGLMLLARRVKQSVREQAARGHPVEVLRRVWVRLAETEVTRLGLGTAARRAILDALHAAIDDVAAEVG